MNKNKRLIYFFIGTTAEFIKLTPLIRELKKRRVSFKIISSGQVEIHFKELEKYTGKVKADIVFQSKGRDSSVIKFVIWACRTFLVSYIRLRKEFSNNVKNVTLVVHGDTVSSLIGSVVAKILHIKLAHVESGLRSFNFLEPFPEEICRYVVSRLADIHFCPNEWAVKNLKKFNGKKINTRFNTLYEIYRFYISNFKSKEVRKKKYFVLVMHRQEHVIFGQRKSKYLLENIAKHIPKDTECVFLVHDISKSFKKIMKEKTNSVLFQRRLPYPEFLGLLHNSEFVLTDGGSNQEELYYMGKPTLLIRNFTERIEGLGDNATLSCHPLTIEDFMYNYKKFRRRPITRNFYASNIIVNELLK